MTLIILLGAPGSGKGSISHRLVREFGFIHLSTGKIFRSAKNENTNTGNLISDDYVNEIILKELSKYKPEDKVILDGYPRTNVQAEFLAKHYPVELVFILANITDEYIIKRLSNRLLCRQEEHSFNLIYHPPKVPGICDFDGSELYKRPDDESTIMQKRLEVYRKFTQPLIEYYRKNNRVIEIDAVQEIDEMVKSIVRYLPK